MSGPPPKPTRLKILEGNPGKRPLPKAEPQPKRGIPTRPEGLTPEAKREWTRVTGELDRVGLLTVVDRAELAMYCQHWARWWEAQKLITVNGLTYTTDKGEVKIRPEVKSYQEDARLIRNFCADYGLSPSARARMVVPGQKDVDELDEIMGNYG
jgi:P27 family predicted phage terminase small subunit